MIYSEKQTRGILFYNSETGKFWKEFSNGTRKDFKGLHSAGYVHIQFNGRKELGHRIAWYLVHGSWPTEIDHINRIRDDNRICNLREVTSQENSRNMGAKGYHFNKRQAAMGYKPWQAYIKQDYKQYHLGCYWTEEEARQAYLDARKKFGWDK